MIEGREGYQLTVKIKRYHDTPISQDTNGTKRCRRLKRYLLRYEVLGCICNKKWTLKLNRIL